MHNKRNVKKKYLFKRKTKLNIHFRFIKKEIWGKKNKKIMRFLINYKLEGFFYGCLFLDYQFSLSHSFARLILRILVSSRKYVLEMCLRQKTKKNWCRISVSSSFPNYYMPELKVLKVEYEDNLRALIFMSW